MQKFLTSYLGFSIIAVAITFLVIVLSLPLTQHFIGDSHWYVAVAEGHLTEVIKPFSGRVLHPFIVGWLDSHFPIDLNQSFLLVAEISLFAFLLINSFILKKAVRLAPLLAFIFFTPYLFFSFHEIFLPDLFYHFLIAIFLLFLFYEMEWAGILVLFLLFLARESTIFLGLILLAVSAFRSKRTLFIVTLFVFLFSLFISSQINNLGISNAHNLSSVFYMVLKMPYNLLNNVFGLKLWVNTLAQNCDPIFSLNLPQWVPFGSINKIGFCGFDLFFPLSTAVTLLTAFGIMPAIVFWAIFYKFKSIIKESPFWLVIAFIYGLGSYLISPLVTTGVQRFVGYGWPVFLLAVPFFMSNFLKIDKGFIIKLSLMNIFVAWLPLIVGGGPDYKIGVMVLMLLVVAVSYFYTFRLVKNQAIKTA